MARLVCHSVRNLVNVRINNRLFASNAHLAVRTVWPMSDRLVAVGDIHGDSEAFEHLLCVSGIITKPGGQWSAGRTIFAQVVRPLCIL